MIPNYHHRTVKGCYSTTMDPMGLAAGVVSILDVTTRCISKLRDLQKRFKEAEMTIRSLSGLLVTVSACLRELHALLSEVEGDCYYQLKMDLENGVGDVHVIIRFIEDDLMRFELHPDNSLSVAAKLRVAFADSGSQSYVVCLGHHINALNLLVNIFKWYASLPCPAQCLLKPQPSRDMAKQQQLLMATETRQVLDKTKEDTASLVVHCDSSTIASEVTTTTLSDNLSTNFTSDNELLQHKRYKATFRSLVRKQMRRWSLSSSTLKVQSATSEPTAEEDKAEKDPKAVQDKQQGNADVDGTIRKIVLGLLFPDMVAHRNLCPPTTGLKRAPTF